MRVGKRGRETGREEDEEKVRKDARKLEGGRGVPHLPLRLTPLARDRRLLLLIRLDRLLDGALAGGGGFELLALTRQLRVQRRHFHFDAEKAQ